AKSLGRIRNSIAFLDNAIANGGGTDKAAGTALLEAMQTAKDGFENAMNDDFNTALAIAAVFDFCKAVNSNAKGAEPKVLAEAKALFTAFDSVIGAFAVKTQADDGLSEELMQVIIKIRQDARTKKDWATADSIRDSLKAIGIVLEDGADGVRWKRV
ncbi:MAG: cysteine--tRNA ligase, partial [Clostridia bacterium]|nr:cysteine--tRNA ligase [Clostridia bacterium]